MMISNFERMIQLAENTFAHRTDTNQLSVDEKVLKRLHRIHPATVSEYVDGDGPVVWIIVFPTTNELMENFLKGKISEKELYDQTPLHIKYEAIYLCSAMVLKEFRRKGIAQKLTLEAIESIREDHPIKSLFVWAFSKEGDALAEHISKLTALPLRKKLSGN
jgi:ribosomal protein S18 acetylase RimI-like enzyme